MKKVSFEQAADRSQLIRRLHHRVGFHSGLTLPRANGRRRRICAHDVHRPTKKGGLGVPASSTSRDHFYSQLAHNAEMELARQRLTTDYGLGDDPDVLFSKADELYTGMRYAECYKMTTR